MTDRNDPESADPHKIAMPKSGSPQGDAAGALQGGEARHGDSASAPRPLGRKDPTTTGDAAPDKDNVQIRG